MAKYRQWCVDVPLFFALKRNKLASKALRAVLKAAFETRIKEEFSIYVTSPQDSALLHLFDQPSDYDDNLYQYRVSQFYMPWTENNKTQDEEIRAKLDFDKLQVVDGAYLAHPMIPGISRVLPWRSLVCEQCGYLSDNCQCCPDCGEYDCICDDELPCEECGNPMADCTCGLQQDEDLPTVNEGPGEGPMFA